MTLRRLVLLWGPVLLLLGLVFYLSSLPSHPMPVRFEDKVLHFLAYGVIAVTWLRAVHGGFRPLRPGATLLAVALTIAYGISDELHQSFVPGRDASLLDLLADALGAIAGAVILGVVLGRDGPGRRGRETYNHAAFEGTQETR